MPVTDNFDRGKPFYPLILNSLIFLHGFKELAARGLAAQAQKEAAKSNPQRMAEELRRLLVEPGSEEEVRKLRRFFEVLPEDYLPPLQLLVAEDGSRITVDSADLAEEIL